MVSDQDAVPPPPGFAPDPPGSHFDPNQPEHLSTVTVATGNSDVIWAAHNNGHLFFSTNGTDNNPSWTRVDENGGGLPDRWISTVQIDPENHAHIYVAMMGWESDNLWETTDNGATWTDVSGNGSMSIPNAPISAMTMHPNLDGWLFVGTDIGIFSSSDNGLSWSTSPEGPAAVPVEQLLWKDHHSLLAVTHGRGMYVATEDSVVADDDKFLDGVVSGGTLMDASTSNNIYYSILPSPTGNPQKQIVEVIFQGTSTTETPTVFQFRLQSKMLGGPVGNVIQSIVLLNYDTGQYEQMDVRSAALEDETILVTPTGDISRFVHSITKEITARIKWESPQFIDPPFSWSVDIDESIWLIKE